MDNKEIAPVCNDFDFSRVPSWYVLCTNNDYPLSPEEQQWIRNYVKSFGYDWEVEFDRYFEDYVYHHQEILSD